MAKWCGLFPVDGFQIGNAETYDVIVQPMADKAFTIVCEAVDRSGWGVRPWLRA